MFSPVLKSAPLRGEGVSKRNPYHDAQGQFTSKDKAGAGYASMLHGKRTAAQAEADARKEADAMPPPPPKPTGFRQPKGETLDGLYEVALASRPEFDGKLEVLSKDLGAGISSDFKGAMGNFLKGDPGAVIIMGPVKGKKRVEEKAWDYAADNGGKPDFSQIGDILRCTVAVDSVSEIADVMAGLYKTGFELGREPKLRMSKPTGAGYHDVMLNAKLSTGHVVEVQINTKKMLLAKDEAHAHYEVQRSIEGLAVKEQRPLTPAEKAEVKRLENLQRSIYSKAWKDSGG